LIQGNCAAVDSGFFMSQTIHAYTFISTLN
jgi:hypothetical protein